MYPNLVNASYARILLDIAEAFIKQYKDLSVKSVVNLKNLYCPLMKYLFL